MSGILNMTRVKKMLTKFLLVVRQRWQIHPDIINGNTIKWRVDSSWSTGGTLGRASFTDYSKATRVRKFYLAWTGVKDTNTITCFPL